MKFIQQYTILFLFLGLTTFAYAQNESDQFPKKIILKKTVINEDGVTKTIIEKSYDEDITIEEIGNENKLIIKQKIVDNNGEIKTIIKIADVERTSINSPTEDVKMIIKKIEMGDGDGDMEELIKNCEMDIHVDIEDGVKHQIIKIKTIDNGQEPQIMEWIGEGELPADIQQKLEGLDIDIYLDGEQVEMQMNKGIKGETIIKKSKKIVIINQEEETKTEATEETAVAQDEPTNPTTTTNITTTLALKDFSLFPNPTGGIVNLEFKGEAMPTLVKVVDASGRAIHTENIHNFDGTYNRQLQLKDAAEGTLFLTITQGDKIHTEKIVLKKA